MRDRLSTRALLIAAVFALLMASFAVGGLVYALGKRGGGDVEENRSQVAKNIGRTERDFPQLILVPEADSSSTIGQSITSAPIPDPDHKVPSEFQRSDATALPSSEYSRLLEQSRRGESQSQPPASVDPRTVKTPQPGAASPPPPPPSDSEEVEPSGPAEPKPEPERRPERAQRSDPVPIYQPLPRIKDREEEIEESGTMRFRLTIDPSGNVKEIRVIETMPGMTGKMIAAIQRWKFKPATENGVPVEGTFMVDISFNAPE